MNRRIITAITTGAALATGVGLLAGCSDQSGRELLQHVPAETAFYGGTTDPEVAEQYRQINAAQMAQFAKLAGGQLEALDPKATVERSGAAAGMLVGLYKSVIENAGSDNSQASSFGIQSDGASAVYAAGALPVMRVVLDDSEQFWRRITDLEDRAGVDADTPSREGSKLRRYAFDTGDAQKRLDLVVATRNRYAVITLAGSGISDEALALALGEQQPENSLADTDKLAKLTDKHGFMTGSLAYIDHHKIVGALTGSSDNRLAAMTNRLLDTWSEEGTTPLAAIRDDACAADMVAIAEQWPYTTAGLTGLETETSRVDSRLVMPTTNTDLAKSLQGLRGHIPQPSEGRPLLGVGVGLDSNQFAATVQDLSKRFTDAKLGCPALQAMQQRVRNQSLNSLVMAERMVGDVRGIGVALRELTSTGPGPMAMDVDAIAEIATPEPESLWQFIQSTAGLPAANKPEPGGDPVSVDLPRMAPFDAGIAIRENSLVALAGEAQLDAAAGETDLAPNGIVAMRYDYGAAMARMMEQIPGASGSAGTPSMDALEAINLYYEVALDATDDGIRMDLAIFTPNGEG